MNRYCHQEEVKVCCQRANVWTFARCRCLRFPALYDYSTDRSNVLRGSQKSMIAPLLLSIASIDVKVSPTLETRSVHHSTNFLFQLVLAELGRSNPSIFIYMRHLPQISLEERVLWALKCDAKGKRKIIFTLWVLEQSLPKSHHRSTFFPECVARVPVSFGGVGVRP